MLAVVVGPSCAGKTTVGAFLELQCGFQPLLLTNHGNNQLNDNTFASSTNVSRTQTVVNETDRHAAADRASRTALRATRGVAAALSAINSLVPNNKSATQRTSNDVTTCNDKKGKEPITFETVDQLLHFVTANWRKHYVLVLSPPPTNTSAHDVARWYHVWDVLSKRPFAMLVSVDAPVRSRFLRFINRDILNTNWFSTMMQTLMTILHTITTVNDHDDKMVIRQEMLTIAQLVNQNRDILRKGSSFTNFVEADERTLFGVPCASTRQDTIAEWRQATLKERAGLKHGEQLSEHVSNLHNFADLLRNNVGAGSLVRYKAEFAHLHISNTTDYFLHNGSSYVSRMINTLEILFKHCIMLADAIGDQDESDLDAICDSLYALKESVTDKLIIDIDDIHRVIGCLSHEFEGPLHLGFPIGNRLSYVEQEKRTPTTSTTHLGYTASSRTSVSSTTPQTPENKDDSMSSKEAVTTVDLGAISESLALNSLSVLSPPSSSCSTISISHNSLLDYLSTKEWVNETREMLNISEDDFNLTTNDSMNEMKSDPWFSSSASALTSKEEFTKRLSDIHIVDEERLRPGWDRYFMELANFASERSNCMKRRVGCVLVNNHRIIATGYNGTPRGLTNCNEGGCSRCNEVATSGCGSNLDLCLCLHAEENALLEAGRKLVEKEGETILYCNTCPCIGCAKKIVQVGVKKVVYSQEYGMDKLTSKLLHDAGIELHQLRPLKKSFC